MKNLVLLFLIFILIQTSLFSQNANVTDYDVPISRARTLRFDGYWNWGQKGSDSVLFNNAQANLLFRAFYTSLPMAWFLNLDASGGKSLSELTHNVKFEGSFRKYIWETEDVFAFNKLNAQHEHSYKQIASDLTVGFGFGRYINATALAKAVRIEDHLIKDKVISERLPKKILIEIAHLIEKQNEYISNYGEIYETKWLDDIEHKIEESNLVADNNIGSLGTLRMRQVLFNINEKVNERYYGWDVNLGVLFPLTTADKSAPGRPNLNLSGRYSVPLGWKFQVNTVADLFTPLDSSFFNKFGVRFGLDFIYELSNRVNFVTNYRLSVDKPQGSKSLISNNLGASFWYYIENNIYFTFAINYTKQQKLDSFLSTNVGIQYNLF
ncbi:MAG TPA: hypothetical protein VFF33_07045 [Ignavibacteriaceae bacterium]|nr:hypothetical protein [Ignavibacteriaceae bacterium]